MSPRDRRARLAREIILNGIRAYDEALAQSYRARDVFDEYWPEGREVSADSAAERAAWLNLILQANQAFDAAEMRLATAIQNLWDWVAPAGELIESSEGPPDFGFATRAVMAGGRRYVLTYNVDQYDPETNIIAVIGPGRTLDLDRA